MIIKTIILLLLVELNETGVSSYASMKGNSVTESISEEMWNVFS